MNTDQALLAQGVPPLLYWYAANKRVLPWRDDPTPYHVWISEIMLQQTRVEAVKPYYTRFLDACPTVQALAEIDEDRLMKLWEGLGYYSRARNLKRAAIQIQTDHGGELPRDYDALLSLPGIGAYTAGAIASIAMGMPIPAVDGNVLRVLARLLALSDNISKQGTKNKVSSLLSSVYPTTPEEASAFTQALMELGATVCIPNGAPHCSICPLKGFCRANEQNLTELLPIKAQKNPRRIEKKTVLLLFCGNTVAVRKRTEKGLLSGLYEFPNVSGHLTRKELLALPLLSGCASVSPLGGAKHIFTHVEWDMIGYAASIPAPQCGYEWKTPKQIKEECAVASAFGAYLKILDQTIKSEESL